MKNRLTSSSNSSDGRVKKVEVPLVVQVRNHSCSLILLLITELLCLIFRKVYKALTDDDESNFDGFDAGLG